MHVVLEIRIALPPSIPPATSQSCSWGSCCLSVNPFHQKEEEKKRKKVDEEESRREGPAGLPRRNEVVCVRVARRAAHPPWTTTSPLQMP